jgi:putative cofactor-binding repeat protein
VSARPRNDIRTDSVVTQVVYISKTVYLRGGYTTVNWSVSDPTAHPTILDAQGRGRVIYITGDISSTVEGLRIAGGNGSSDYPVGLGIGGGVYIINAAATLKGCQVYSNTAEWEGGGIYLNRSPSTLIGNIFTGNSAQEGGGVYLEFSDATVSGNIIQGNTARRITTVYGNGGGLHVFASAATLSGNTVVSNTAYAGGGMYLSSGAATLGSNIVSGNTASDGGGVFLVSGSATTWSDNTIEGNTASRGGGLYLWAPTGAWLNSNILRSNRADLGGGAYLAQCDATLVNTIIAENQANTSGSGVYIEMGTPRFLYTTIARNSGGDGSGIYATNTSWVPSSVALTNTILVSHTVGISVTGSITVAVTVNGVLWFDTPITVSQSATATVTVQNQRGGDPAFAGSDYHVRPTSAAVNQGVADDYALDVDGEYRPLVTWGLNSATYDLPVSATYARVSHRPDQYRRRDEPWAVATLTSSC